MGVLGNLSVNSIDYVLNLTPLSLQFQMFIMRSSHVLLLCVIACATSSNANHSVEQILYNWLKIGNVFHEFQKQVLKDEEAFDKVAETYCGLSYKKSKTGAFGLRIIMENYWRSSLDIYNATRQVASGITENKKYDVKGYSIWNLCEDFTSNPVEIVSMFEKAATSFPDKIGEVAQWIIRMEEELIDIKRSYLLNRSWLQKRFSNVRFS